MGTLNLNQASSVRPHMESQNIIEGATGNAELNRTKPDVDDMAGSHRDEVGDDAKGSKLNLRLWHGIRSWSGSTSTSMGIRKASIEIGGKARWVGE